MLLIQGGTVKPITGSDIENGQVLVDGGKIVAVGKNLDIPAGCEVFDASGCLVTPGFVEAHCHIGLDEEAVRWEGKDYNEYSDPVTPEMRAIDGLNPRDEALALAMAGGVTTACTGPGSANVLGGTFAVIKLRGHRVDDMILREPAAMKVAFGENPKGCYGQQGKKSPVTRMAIAARLREMLMRAKLYDEELREWEKAPEGKKRPYDMKLEALLPVIRREIPLKAHAHRADDIFTALRIAREFDVDITLDHVTEGHLIAEDLAREGRPVLVGPSLGHKSKFELREKSFKTPGVLHAAGLPVCIITDAPVIPLSYLPLCAGLAVKSGLPIDEAWRAITINPARALGVSGRVGSLEVGKDADIAIFRGNPLTDIDCRTVQVFVDGIAVL